MSHGGWALSMYIIYIVLSEMSQLHKDKYGTILLIGGTSYKAKFWEIEGASLAAQLVKNPPEMRDPWVWPLGWEDPLEKGKATHSSILAWRISRTV